MLSLGTMAGVEMLDSFQKSGCSFQRVDLHKNMVHNLIWLCVTRLLSLSLYIPSAQQKIMCAIMALSQQIHIFVVKFGRCQRCRNLNLFMSKSTGAKPDFDHYIHFCYKWGPNGTRMLLTCGLPLMQMPVENFLCEEHHASKNKNLRDFCAHEPNLQS